jgi:6-phospho-3-hexuloisomerase
MDIRNVSRQICDEIASVIAAVDDAAVERLIEGILAARRVHLAGVGRSGWIARCLAMRLAHLDRHVHVVGDATTPKITGDDLLMVCTGSGETPTIIGYMETARRVGVKVAVLTACLDSTAAQPADIAVHLPAPTPKARQSGGSRSIQPMGSLFEQSLLVFGDALIVLLADRLGQDHDQMWQRHANLE